eukprot:SAG31_NODE_374_length_16577_cov_9.902173_11_plen_149_part_00
MGTAQFHPAISSGGIVIEPAAACAQLLLQHLGRQERTLEGLLRANLAAAGAEVGSVHLDHAHCVLGACCVVLCVVYVGSRRCWYCRSRVAAERAIADRLGCINNPVCVELHSRAERSCPRCRPCGPGCWRRTWRSPAPSFFTALASRS